MKNNTKIGAYSIQAAASLAGIPAGTLRAWEARYGVTEPGRAASGHRRYDEAQVARLQKVATLVRRGHTVSEVARLSDRRLDELLTADFRRGAEAVPELSPEAKRQLDGLLAAVESGRLPEVVARLKWLRSVLGIRLFVLGVAVPLFAQIGTLVAASRLSIAEEHAISAVLRGQLGDTIHSLTALSMVDSGRSPPVVFATPEDDMHEFGILLSAALAGAHGLPVFYAGANLPARALADACRAAKAKLVVLGNAPVPASERRQSLVSYLRALDEVLPQGVELLIGGAGDRPLESMPSKRPFGYVAGLSDWEARLAAEESR